jgi:hypothetical protein
MKPKIGIPLALGGMFFGAAITIANADKMFVEHLYLLYLCAGAAVAMVVTAIVGAVIDASRKPKKDAEQSHSPIGVHLEKIGNPTQTVEVNPHQAVYIGADLLQRSPAPIVRDPQPEPQSNIQFVEVKAVDGTFSRTMAHRLPLTIKEATRALLVCLRNEAGPGQTPRQPQVDAHIIYKDADGKELTDLFHGAWVNDREDYSTFQTSQKKCLVVAVLTDRKLLKIWKKQYHTDTSWMAGPLFEIQTEQIPGTLATVVIQLVDHWKGTFIKEFVFDVQPLVEGQLPQLKLKS